jgi:hypothetical protein
VSTQEPPRRPPAPEQPRTEPVHPAANPRQARRPVGAEPVYERERLPPEAAPPRPWWDNPWPALTAGLLALLAGGALGYVIGHKSEGSRAPGVTHTVTNTATVTQPKTVVQTNTVTASTVKETQSPVNRANEERRREAETTLRKTEQENRELRRQVEEAGHSP